MNSDEWYQILELTPSASLREIKAAYHQLAKVWHPDRFAGDPALARKANDKLILINLAYNAILAARGRQGGKAGEAPEESETWGDIKAAPDTEPGPAPPGGVLGRWRSRVWQKMTRGVPGEFGPLRGRMEVIGAIIGALLSLALNLDPAEPWVWETLLLVPLGYGAGLLGGSFVLRWTVVLAIAAAGIYMIAGGVYAILGLSSVMEGVRSGLAAGGTAGFLVLTCGTVLFILYRLLARSTRKRRDIARRSA
jgi:hypothetical protein